MGGNTKPASPLANEKLENAIQRLETEAADAVVAATVKKCWTFFVRLSWSWPVTEFTAQHHIADWAERLQRRLPGAAVRAGLHTDQGRIHAHAFVLIPRRGAPQHRSSSWLRACAETWHQKRWPHGLIWLDRFAPSLSARGAAYSFREVGSVMEFGVAPTYRPRRTRRGRK
jgi:hypothetical protein